MAQGLHCKFSGCCWYTSFRHWSDLTSVSLPCHWGWQLRGLIAIERWFHAWHLFSCWFDLLLFRQHILSRADISLEFDSFIWFLIRSSRRSRHCWWIDWCLWGVIRPSTSTCLLSLRLAEFHLCWQWTTLRFQIKSTEIRSLHSFGRSLSRVLRRRWTLPTSRERSVWWTR